MKNLLQNIICTILFCFSIYLPAFSKPQYVDETINGIHYENENENLKAFGKNVLEYCSDKKESHLNNLCLKCASTEHTIILHNANRTELLILIFHNGDTLGTFE